MCFYPLPYISSTGVVELSPAGATLSSTKTSDFEAEKCIDGDIDSEDISDGVVRICHSKNEPKPWLAIDYGATVRVQRVEIFNRIQCCGDRTRNVDVRILGSNANYDR